MHYTRRNPFGELLYGEELIIINPSPGPLGAIAFLGDSKWKYAGASLLLGGTAMALLGQPTLLQVFSDKLEVKLWDTSDIVRNNLIASAVALAGLLLLNR